MMVTGKKPSDSSQSNAAIQSAYNSISHTCESKKPLDAAGREQLRTRMSGLSPNEAQTAYELMKCHKQKFPKAEGKGVSNAHIYSSEDTPEGLKFYMENIPPKLALILDEFTRRISDVDD